ncbi:MAG: hypothetical protein J6U01_11920 [Clostridia bacterium]|nr:hypothetical protein [Clostridia bacterium]
MKVYVQKTSQVWGEGKAREYSNLSECIDSLLDNEDYGRWAPSVIVSRADDMTTEECGEKCDYEILIYDD